MYCIVKHLCTRQPSLPKEVAACASCHGKNSIGLSYEFPNLAGQKKEYLAKQLNAFKKRERKYPTMNIMAAALTDNDIDVITNYFSKLSNVQQTTTKTVVKGTSKASIKEFPEDVFITMKKSA